MPDRKAHLNKTAKTIAILLVAILLAVVGLLLVAATVLVSILLIDVFFAQAPPVFMAMIKHL
jgi:hypothetical protein